MGRLTENRVADAILLATNIATNKRFRNDVKALMIAKKGYTEYAWDLLLELKIDPLLSNGATLSEIKKKRQIKDSILLEYILDLLVGAKALTYKKEKYFINSPPTRLSKKELDYMQKHYPASYKWTMLMIKRAKHTLTKGKKHQNSSFNQNESALLWDKIMYESPFSLRKVAIKELIKDTKTNNKILDIGCGTGASLLSIAEEARVNIQLYGSEPSNESVKIAKQNIKNRIKKEKNELLKSILSNTKFIKHDFLKSGTKEKYDRIFLSFVINHIPKNKRRLFFRNIRHSLSLNGICVIYQLVSEDKFSRVPMWVMHNVPTHQEFPFLSDYREELTETFEAVNLKLKGMISILE